MEIATLGKAAQRRREGLEFLRTIGFQPLRELPSAEEVNRRLTPANFAALNAVLESPPPKLIGPQPAIYYADIVALLRCSRRTRATTRRISSYVISGGKESFRFLSFSMPI